MRRGLHKGFDVMQTRWRWSNEVSCGRGQCCNHAGVITVRQQGVGGMRGWAEERVTQIQPELGGVSIVRQSEFWRENSN